MKRTKLVPPGRPERGFSLVEMLISVLIFSFVVLGMLYMFDKGRWLYLHSENRANLQENGRLMIEDIERNLRMAGLGVPFGTEIGSAETFIPYVFVADESEIAFRGDIDNANTLLTSAVASGDAQFLVRDGINGCPDSGKIILVERGRNWEPFTCSGETATTMNIAPAAADEFQVEECEVYSPDHVFYRLSPDADGDGVCEPSGSPPDYQSCVLQKCELFINDPQDDDAGCTYQTIGTNVAELHFEYMFATDPFTSYTTIPLTKAQAATVDTVRVRMVTRDRADQVAQYQDLEFVTDVFVRKKGL